MRSVLDAQPVVMPRPTFETDPMTTETTRSAAPDRKVFAFWRYDLYPYVLGSEGKILSDGNFKADGYGGSTFRRDAIISVMPIEQGRQVQEKLQQERDQLQVDQAKRIQTGLDSINVYFPDLRSSRTRDGRKPR